MTLPVPAKTGLFSLLGESFRDLGRYKIIALCLPIFLAATSIIIDLLHAQSDSGTSLNGAFACIHVLVMFLWLKTLSGEILKDSTSVTKGMGYFGYYALGAFVLLVIGVTVCVVGAIILFPSPDGSNGIRASVASFFGILLVSPLLIKFAFVYPAAAFREKTSFAMSWRQTKGWFWRLAGGYVLLLLGTLVALCIIVLAVNVLGDSGPVLIGVGALSAFVGGIFDLLIAGFTAHAYRAAVGIPAQEMPQG